MGEPDAGYSGMTVNERLVVAGVLDLWDVAILAGDRQAAIDLLCTVDMSPDSAARTVDAVFDNPAMYGFHRHRMT